jgi:hypothetical protein
MLLEVLDTGGTWSIARVLASNVRFEQSHLAQCDFPRRHDRDSRGNLGETTLDTDNAK